MSEKLTNLAQLRMTAEKSKELSAQIAAAVAEAIEELDRSKANTAHSHTAADVGALSTSGGSVNGHVCFSDGNADGSSLNIDDYEIRYTDAYGSGILLSAITDSGGNGCKVYVLSGSASLLCTLRNFVEMGWTDTWIDMEGNRITNSPSPQGDTDVANKKYVDSIAEAAGMPSGAIVMWSGAQNSIPTGWALCNGQNGTPDLRNRFVLGAGDKYAVGAKGGEETHELTWLEMPSHSHGISDNFISVSPFADMTAQDVYAKRYNAVPDDGSYITTESGGSNAHNNMPPYYALCYIMKT